jgi:transcriptional regulator with XRE-family HTH domain
MLSKRIRQLRLGKGLTLERVATELGVTRASVSKWETGTSYPEYSRLDQLAQILGVTAAQLIQDDGAKPNKSCPVVDFVQYDRVDDFMFRRHRPQTETYPTVRVVSDAAFYMRIETKEVKNLWLKGIQSGALVLFDPAHPYTTDDLIFAHDSRGDCHLLYVKNAEGVRYYQAFIGNKKMYREKDYLVVLGVALESIYVSQLTHGNG